MQAPKVAVKGKVLSLLSILLIAAPLACKGKGKSSTQGGAAPSGASSTSTTQATISIPSKAGADGSYRASIDSTSGATQTIALEDGALAGAAISFPPGSLAVATEIIVQESAPLTTPDVVKELGIAEGSLAPASSALIIEPKDAVDPSQPFQVSLVLNDSATLALNFDPSHVGVLFNVKSYATGGSNRLGLIPPSQLSFDGNVVIFSSAWFGAFQLVISDTPIEAPIEVPTDKAITSKASVPPPAAFAITGPQAKLGGGDVTISWTVSDEDVVYDVVVASDQNCLQPTLTHKELATTSLSTKFQDGSYFVCVTARGPTGLSTTASNNGYAFALKTSSPGSFSITAPDGFVDSAKASFAWTASADASSYTLLIASDSSCTSPVKSLTEQTATTIEGPELAEGSYYICVTAVDDFGHSTAASNSGLGFTVDLTAPGSFSINGPNARAGSSFTGTWDSADGAASYEVKLASDSSCSDVLFEAVTDGQTSYNFSDAPLSQRYLCVTAVDQAGHRTEASNNGYKVRVAPIVLGQQDATSNRIAARELRDPVGIALGGGRLYVSEAVNQRVAGYNSVPTTDGAAANFVLGQINPETRRSGDNVDATTTLLTAPDAMYSDGTRLFVCDTNAHRVLIWNTLPASNAVPADIVLGQPTMETTTANNGGLSAQSLYNPSGVYFTGSKLIVADASNHRVLIWNSLPTSNHQAADVAIGQADLASASVGTGANQELADPAGVLVTAGKLLVADRARHRVMVWNSIPTASGTAADFVIGQDEFGNTSANRGSVTDAYGLSSPHSLVMVGGTLFVSDTANNRILAWSNLPSSSGIAADFVLGQSTTSNASANAGGLSATSLDEPKGLATDGTRLLAVDSGNERVLIWNAVPTSNSEAANVVVGKRALNASEVIAIDASVLLAPAGAHFDGQHLLVADKGANRVLIWLTPPNSHNQPADLVLGQATMQGRTINAGGTASATTLSAPTAVYSDGERVVVADSGNNRVLVWNSFPTANQQAADVVVGHSSFSSSIASDGATASGIQGPSSAMLCDGKLVVADRYRHRVLIWNSLPTSNGVAADVALGQANLTSAVYPDAFSASNFVYPLAASCLAEGGFIIHHSYGEGRLLAWGSMPSNNNQGAHVVLSRSQEEGGIAAAWSANSKLYLIDSQGRTMVWNNFPSSSSTPYDYRLGEVSSANYGLRPLGEEHFGSELRLTGSNTALVVSDYGHSRVLFFPDGDF